MKMECDYLYGWIRKRLHNKNLAQMVNPRDIAGNAEEEEQESQPQRYRWKHRRRRSTPRDRDGSAEKGEE